MSPKNLTVTIFSVIFCFWGCSKDPKALVISGSEEFLNKNFVPTLKDPSSYEIISTEIVDTVSKRQEILDDIEYSKDDLRYQKSQLDQETSNPSIGWALRVIEFEESIKLNEKRIQILTDSLQKVDMDRIGYLIIDHKFKSLNGLGLVAPGNCILLFKESGYKGGEKYFLYSRGNSKL